jgi:hypothetical protein
LELEDFFKIWQVKSPFFHGKKHLVGGLKQEFYDFPFSWEWNNHPN